MARLRLIQIKCLQTEDATGPDEPYLIVNGSEVWRSPSLNNGGAATLLGIAPIPFFGTAAVQLFDEDIGLPWDPDDSLGLLQVSDTLMAAGPQIGRFLPLGPVLPGSFFHYELSYQVLP